MTMAFEKKTESSESDVDSKYLLFKLVHSMYILQTIETW